MVEFTDDVERVVRSGEQSQRKQCGHILSLLPQLCEGALSRTKCSILLRDATGEKHGPTQLWQPLYNRKQIDGENLQDYSLALSLRS